MHVSSVGSFNCSVSKYIHIDASHLDTLDGQRMDMKHVMMEPNPKMALVDASWREKNPLE